jgi:hypothetical protein
MKKKQNRHKKLGKLFLTAGTILTIGKIDLANAQTVTLPVNGDRAYLDVNLVFQHLPVSTIQSLCKQVFDVISPAEFATRTINSVNTSTSQCIYDANNKSNTR